MALLETIHLSHLPHNTPAHIALYRDIKNASLLREQLISGNVDFQYAFIDASVVLSRQHIFAAVFRAVHDYLNGRLRSHNVHSEIVFSLNPTNNISESFRRFGITDATEDLLVVKVSTTPEITHDSVAEHLNQCVEGTPAPFNDETLSSISDLAKIRKAYKIPQPPAKSADNKEVNGHIQREFEAPIIGAIALRGAT